MFRMVHGLALVLLVLLVATGSRGDGPPPAMPGLLASQVSVEIRHDRTQSQFRGTVIAREGDMLTVVTAAHCLAAGDVGRTARVRVGEAVLRAEVTAVVWNPSYRPKLVNDLHGPDSAVAKFRVEVEDPPSAEAFATIHPARGPIEHAFPHPGGRTVVVRVVDAKGREHVVRAGNHMNPRWLEWGPAYFPQPGDSGGGVFWDRPGPDGKPAPVLVGTVVGHDARGGGASLVSLDQRWLAEVLPRPDKAPDPARPD